MIKDIFRPSTVEASLRKMHPDILVMSHFSTSKIPTDYLLDIKPRSKSLWVGSLSEVHRCSQLLVCKSTPDFAMTSVSQRILFFGDQTVDPLTTIKTLHRRAKNVHSLARFLRDAADIVQQQLSDLDLQGHEQYAEFDTIVELAEVFSRNSDTHETIGCALWCVAQCGDLIL